MLSLYLDIFNACACFEWFEEDVNGFKYTVFFSFVGWGETSAHLVRRPLIGLLYQHGMINEYETFGGMRLGKGNRSTRRKPAPVPVSSPQIPRDLTWDRTRAAVVGSRQPTS
jgi:hypothetical protein